MDPIIIAHIIILSILLLIFLLIILIKLSYCIFYCFNKSKYLKCKNCNQSHHNDNFNYLQINPNISCSCQHSHEMHDDNKMCFVCEDERMFTQKVTGRKISHYEKVPKYVNELVKEGVIGYRDVPVPYQGFDRHKEIVYETKRNTYTRLNYVKSYGSFGGYYEPEQVVTYTKVPVERHESIPVTKYELGKEKYWVSEPVYQQKLVGYEDKPVYKDVYSSVGDESKCKGCDCQICIGEMISKNCSNCCCDVCQNEDIVYSDYIDRWKCDIVFKVLLFFTCLLLYPLIISYGIVSFMVAIPSHDYICITLVIIEVLIIIVTIILTLRAVISRLKV